MGGKEITSKKPPTSVGSSFDLHRNFRHIWRVS